MKRLRLGGIGWCAALVALALATTASRAAAAGELVTNGGFDKGGKPAPTGWLLEGKVAGKGKVSVEDGVLVIAPNSKNAPPIIGIGQAIPNDEVGGKTVTLATRMKAEGGANAVALLMVLKKDGELENVRLDQSADGDELVEHEGSLDVPPASQIQLVVLTVGVEGTDGAAYFDDVSVRAGGLGARATPERGVARRDDEDEGGGAVVPVPPSRHGTDEEPPRAARGDGLDATISVDANRTLRTIPRTLFGTNTEWVFDGYGAWDAQRGALHPDVVRLAKELEPSLIRFPGGFFADFYHWRDGIGPRGSRKTTEHHPKGPKSKHNFGTDEVLELARQSGADGHFIVNVVTGTPEEAADWVRYAKKKREEGFPRVTIWEVGNESYIKENNPISKAGTLPPSEYAERFVAFARAMRAADPGIKIGAIGGENAGRYAIVGYKDWNKTVLEKAGGEMDFLAVHNAYAPVFVQDENAEVRDVYQAMYGAPVRIARNLETIDQQIERFAPEPDRVKLAITEWGPLFDVDTTKPFVDHVKTLGSALLTASILKTFIEHPRVEIANFFKLVDASFMGWIGPRGDRYDKATPFLAFQILNEHFGEKLVASRSSGPTFDAKGVGLIDPVSDVPYLDVMASKSSDGRRLYVLAINKHFDRPITASISIEGFTPSGSATAWALTGKAIDANTGTAMREYPGNKYGKQRVADRYQRGGPGEVELGRHAVEDVGARFDYTLPPHSITSLELR